MSLVTDGEFLANYYDVDGVIEYYVPPDKWLTLQTVASSPRPLGAV